MEFLKNIISYVKIIRPVNLMMIGFTHWIFYHFIIFKLIASSSINSNNLFLLILQSICIAAGGYIINDIIDFKADLHNKPHKTYVSQTIPVKLAKYYYFIVVVCGIVLAGILQYIIPHFPIILINISLSITLFVYSIRIKNTVLWGNILISLVVSFVTGIILIAERYSLLQSSDNYLKYIVTTLIITYMVFSFLINLIREIVKDMEDFEGDNATGYMTFPIKYGIQASKNLCISITLITLTCILLWLFTTHLPIQFRSKTFIILFICAPLALVIQTFINTNLKRDFSKVSENLKWIMVAGLVSIIIISSEI